MFIIDAHLDLSMNAMEWNRDLRLPVQKINERENGMADKPDRGNATVSLPDLRKGNIGLVVATLIGRYVDENNPLPGWHSPEQAWAQTQGQLAWYKAMEDAGEMVQINDLASLEKHLTIWTTDTKKLKNPVGYILSLEGADSLITIDHLYKAHAVGLRAVGPAHYGPGRYAQGTDATGFIGDEGKRLLRAMEELQIILDVTHLCDDSFWEALDNFTGAVWGSHNNVRTLVNHNRQLNDGQIKELVNRNAVIGMAFDAWMMVPGWKRGKSNPREMNCSLATIIDHIDHICQIAGNSLHVGLGSDLDGAFGREQTPYDLETIADLQKLISLLEKRGYSASDITGIMHENWLRFLRNAWA